MRESWRWFGPGDVIGLDAVRQTGVAGIVTALHHRAPGEVWGADEIAARRDRIAAHGMVWNVVESLPVSEDIKRQSGDWRAHLRNWQASLRALAECGIPTVCYNFMPVLDWTRTDLAWPTASTATAMRFDWIDFVVFDLFLLCRPGATYDPEVTEAATARFAAMPDARCKALIGNVVYGLPGAAAEMTLADVRDHLAAYDQITEARLRANMADFLQEVAPVAQDLGMRLCCHPDDPPFGLMGLPRVMSTEADYARMLAAVDLPANGITLCSGSLGARADNDLPGMMRRLGGRVHFIHLRNVARQDDRVPASFHESGHLSGDVDMVALIAAILDEEARRRAAGRPDSDIPFRPDHGLNMAGDDTTRGQPGYSLVGRHVGLAELRGVIAALNTYRAREAAST